MSLPRPPISLNTPIPNQPFSAEEVYYLESNQGRLPLGNGLYIDSATGTFTDLPPLAPLAATDAISAEPVVQAAMEPQFPANPEPDQEFTDPATNRTYKWQRARSESGWFIADDPTTPENEAWTWQWLCSVDNTDNT